DRHPSSSVTSPSASYSSGFARNDGPRSPSSKTYSCSETPTCGAARPTPGAWYIVSVMSFTRRRSVRSKCSTGFAGSRRTGSPSVRIGSSIQGPSQMRFGFDALDDPRGGQPPHRVPEGRDTVGLEREQAYRPSSQGRDERRDRVVRHHLAFDLVGPDYPEDRRAHREPGVRTPGTLACMEPIGAATDQRLHRGITRVCG